MAKKQPIPDEHAPSRALQAEKAAQAEALKVAREALQRIATGREVRMFDGSTIVEDLDDADSVATAALAKIDALTGGEVG